VKVSLVLTVHAPGAREQAWSSRRLCAYGRPAHASALCGDSPPTTGASAIVTSIMFNLVRLGEFGVRGASVVERCDRAAAYLAHHIATRSRRYPQSRESSSSARGGPSSAKARARKFPHFRPGPHRKGQRAPWRRLAPHGRMRTIPGANDIYRDWTARSCS
jgi:hypothetical protein